MCSDGRFCALAGPLSLLQFTPRCGQSLVLSSAPVVVVVVVEVPSAARQRSVARRLWAVLAAAASAATALVPRTSSTSGVMVRHSRCLTLIRAGQRRSTCSGLSGYSRHNWHRDAGQVSSLHPGQLGVGKRPIRCI